MTNFSGLWLLQVMIDAVNEVIRFNNEVWSDLNIVFKDRPPRIKTNGRLYKEDEKKILDVMYKHDPNSKFFHWHFEIKFDSLSIHSKVYYVKGSDFNGDPSYNVFHDYFYFYHFDSGHFSNYEPQSLLDLDKVVELLKKDKEMDDQIEKIKKLKENNKSIRLLCSLGAKDLI